MKTNKTHSIFEAETMPFFNDLYRTAYSLTLDQNDAEDLVQETYLQAWKSFEKYELGTNCRAWLYTILFNKHHHFRRRLHARKKYTRDAEDFVFENAPYVAPVPVHLTDKEVIEALNKLPDHYRDVSLLTDVYDFSYKEAAEILGIPIGTVMSRLSRARQYLKQFLANIAGNYGIDSTFKMTGETFAAKFASFLLMYVV